MTKKQTQKGYMAASTMVFILGAIVVLAFVIEVGRMLIASSQVDNGVGLAATGGVYKYTKVLNEETKIAYKASNDKAKEEVKKLEDEGEIFTEEEKEAKIKELTKKYLEEKIPGIKSKARGSCNGKIQELMSQNVLEFVSGSCTDSQVTVTGKTKYMPVAAEIKVSGVHMTRTAVRDIVIETN